MQQISKTDRTTLTRKPDRGTYDKNTIITILKEGIVCHVSLVDEGQVYILPNLYGVGDDKVYIHGSVGSFMLRTLKKEIDLSLCVTLIDGLVLARSAFSHSANYRSVVLFGKASLVEDEEEKMEALKVLTEHIIPKRWEDVRMPNASEMKKTMVLSIPIVEASAKIRSGGTSDYEEDVHLDVWAGVIPLSIEAGMPIPAMDLKEGIEVPGYVMNYSRKSNR